MNGIHKPIEGEKYYYYIYLIKNLVNKKIYIGQRATKKIPEFDNYYGSGKWLKRAYKKYGKKDFKKYIIWKTDNLDKLNRAEQIIIKLYKSRNPDIGYNICPGGLGVGRGEDHPNFGRKRPQCEKEAIRAKMLGKEKSKETRERLSIAIKLSPKTKRGKEHRWWGNKGPSPETILKMRLAVKKFKDIDKSRENYRRAQLKKWEQKQNPLKGIRFHKGRNKFLLHMYIKNRTNTYCGQFDTLEEAIDMRDNILSSLKQYC